MKTKICYWDGIVGAEALIKKHLPTFQKLQHGQYKEADLDLKKLACHRVYSVRTNDADRLLFTTVIGLNSKPYLLLLGEVENHRYDKSPFLQAGNLNAFLNKNAEAIAAEIAVSKDAFKPCDELFLSEGKDEEEKKPKALSQHLCFFMTSILLNLIRFNLKPLIQPCPW